MKAGQENPLREARSLSQAALKRRAAPWAVSLLLHGALLLIFALVTMIVIHVGQAEQITVPAAVWSDEPGRLAPVESRLKMEASKPLSPSPRPERFREAAHRKQDDQPCIELLAQEQALTATAGLCLDAAAGPVSSFYGAGGNAHHVVYVVDRSGSMRIGGVFHDVRRELLTSIGRLAPRQDFHVILFADGMPLENPPAKLVPAEMDYKRRVAEFLIAVRAEHQTDPVPALGRAFETLARSDRRPGKLIYLLTDGEFPDNRAVLQAIRAANADREVKINTYLYADAHPPPQAVTVLKRIAEENGGVFRHVGCNE